MSVETKDVGRSEAVLRARALTKTYTMGDVDVHALRSVDAAIVGMSDRVVQMHSGRIASVERIDRKVTPDEIEWVRASSPR